MACGSRVNGRGSHESFDDAMIACPAEYGELALSRLERLGGLAVRFDDCKVDLSFVLDFA